VERALGRGVRKMKEKFMSSWVEADMYMLWSHAFITGFICRSMMTIRRRSLQADKVEILASASCMTVVCLRADRYEEDGSAESTWACEAGR